MRRRLPLFRRPGDSFNTPLEMPGETSRTRTQGKGGGFQYSIGDAVEYEPVRCGGCLYTLSILHWRCNRRSVTQIIKEMLEHFQYSIGDAVNRLTGEVIRELIDFQYSIGDALTLRYGFVAPESAFQYSIGDAPPESCAEYAHEAVCSFNTPLEMRRRLMKARHSTTPT